MSQNLSSAGDRQSSPFTPVDWEPAFQAGAGQRLAREAPAYGLVAGYVHFYISRGTVLDAGCGEAPLAAYLDIGRISYVGFDISPTAVANAQRGLRSGEVFQASLESYQPASGVKFDAIVFKGSLPCIAEPLEQLDRYFDFIKPSGVVIVMYFLNPDPQSDAARFRPIIEAACTAERYRTLASAEVSCLTQGLAWRAMVLQK